MDAQVAFVDEYPQEMSKLLNREAPKGSNNIPQVGTSAVLEMKQEPQNLVMPAQVAVQNQQELSATEQRCQEASV